MKLYRITSVHNGVVEAQFVSSLTDGVVARKELAEKGLKRADIKQEEVNVPTDKTGLLDFLNNYAS